MMSSLLARDRDGRILLHHAAVDNNVELANELLALGADPNTQDKQGFTPLHFAAQQYALAVAEALLQAGATVDLEDRYGNTPLWRAVFDSRGRGELIRLLLAAGADPRHQNHYGKTPLELARTIADYDLAQYFTDFE